MEEVLGRGFGLCIAYVAPGFVALWGTSFIEPMVGVWLMSAGSSEPTVGSFFYMLLASVAAGLAVSAVRWVVVDSIHRWTGLKAPAWRLSELQENLQAFETMVEHHYRHYQFYANSLVAGSFAVAARRLSGGAPPRSFGVEIAWTVLALIFFVASRDTLRHYYSRVGELLRAEKGKCHGQRVRSS